MSDMDSNADTGVTVEPVTEEQDIVQETEQSDVDTSDEGEENGQSDEHKRPGKVARKMSWLEAQVAAKDREIERLKNPQAAKPEVKEAPKMEDFDDVFDFLDARDDWKHEQRNAKQTEAVSANQEHAEILAKKSDYDKRLISFVGNNQELVQNITAMDNSGLITEAMELSIYESPIGERITAHLSENPDVVMALSKLPEKQQYRVMGAIEAYVAAQGRAKPVTTSAPQGERQTQASPPISPPKSQASKSSTPLWELSQADYEKRMAQMRKR